MREPANILYDISPCTLGGTERFLGRFFASLDSDRFCPVVISGRAGAPLRSVRAQGVATIVVPQEDSSRGVGRLADLMRARNIRLAQSNYYSFTLALAASLAGVPHVWRPGGHASWGSGVRSLRDQRVAVNMMQLLSAAIVCNSQYVASQFAKPSVPVSVIPNGIPFMERAPRRRPGPFRVGMVAHLTPQKRHEQFIRAARHVAAARQDVRFVIHGRPVSGDASRVYAEQVRQAVQSLTRAGRFTMTAFAPLRDDTSPKLDVVVLPSIGESCSNALLEAMASGLPVIATRSGGNVEIVEHRKTGLLVAPDAPRALADAILSLLRRPAIMQVMGDAGRASVRRHYRIETCVTRYERVYERLLGLDDSSGRRARTELS